MFTDLNEKQFVINSLFNGKPVKGVKDKRYMIRFRSSTDEPCSVVWKFLRFVNELLRTASEWRIAVIDSGQDRNRDRCLESIVWQVVTDRINSTQFKIADLTSAGDMLLKREILVGGNVQVADSQVPFSLTEKGTERLFWCLEVM